ncbi:MAG: methylmalonyl-CoA mutase subunit beta, partial [Methylobacteriaceae bacterium]|nr:methylmalonyl-CoA mutase subunit beta [Methylobacteriaceae bacterium]
MADEAGSDLTTADLFSSRTEGDWRGLVDRVLKGAPFDRLVSTTYDGIRLQPLYARARGPLPRALRAVPGRWDILARIDHPDAAAASRQALIDLEAGASGLHLIFAGSVGAHGFGVAGASIGLIEEVLEGVALDSGLAVEIDLGPHSEAAVAIADLVTRRRMEPSLTRIRFGLDPLGTAAVQGGATVAWPNAAPSLVDVTLRLIAQGQRGPFWVADGRVVHAAGGSEAQELAFALGSALAYVRALEAGGVPLDTASRVVGFRLAADADELLTIAKLRALRRLWARIEDACGLSPRPIHIHAETAWRMMTRRDPWVNLLRATVATFCAALGGADAISVQPFTQALGLADAFARRLARNTQLILAEEGHLDKVADPAAGSGAFEALTDELAKVAWALFQDIERMGGIWLALTEGAFQAKVEAVRDTRVRNVAHRRDPITGTSEFPDLAELPVEVIRPLQELSLGPPAGNMTISLVPLAPVRLAEPYERLRDLSDARLARTGARPKIFLANLGRPADFSARASFAAGFFAAGGV